jgi:hypothetical protein
MPLVPLQTAPVADNVRVVTTAPPAETQTQAPVSASPQDQTSVAQTGSAPTQVAIVDEQTETSLPPLQPAIEEADLPSPSHYEFKNTQVIAAFKEKHGRRVLSAQTGEAMATAVLGQLGIDPGDESAVRRLQRKIGAYPDGKFGPETWGKAIAYLSSRHDRGDVAAQDGLAILLTPTSTGAGGQPVIHQPPPRQTQPVDPGPALPPPVEQQQPAELTETQVRDVLSGPSSEAMEKQIDDASYTSSDDVAYNNLTNPSALFAMKPKTVAKSITAMIAGWTTKEETKAMMTGLRSQAATGKLGETLANLDIGDLKDALSDEQNAELKTMVSDPYSGATAEQAAKF